MFPKGIPVARVVEVTPADVSLFQKVYAEPLLALRYYEELLVLSRKSSGDSPQAEPAAPAAADAAVNATAGPAATPAVNASEPDASGQQPSKVTRHPVRKRS